MSSSASVAGPLVSRLRAPAGGGRAVVVVAMTMAVVAGTLAGRLETNVILLLALGLVVLAPITQRVALGRFDLLEPLTLFTIAFGVMFLARPIAMLVADSFLIERPPDPTYDVRPGFSRMLVVSLAGALAFQVAYASVLGVRMGRAVRLRRSVLHEDTALAYAVVLTVVGVALYAVFIVQSGGLSFMADLFAGFTRQQRLTRVGSVAYFSQGPLLLVPAALILLALAYSVRMRFGAVVIGSAVLTLLALRIVPQGSRMILTFLIGSLLAYRFLRSGSRPRAITIAMLALVGFAAITVFPIIREREARRDIGLVGAVVEPLQHPGAAMERLLLGSDTQMASNLALAVEIVPRDRPFTLGKTTFGDLAVRPIPRALWSGKPLTPRNDLIQSLWPAGAELGIVNPEFSALAWFYLDLGILGVVLGMFAFGVLYRAAWSFFLADDSNTLVRLIYASLYPVFIIALRDSFVDTVMRMAFVVLPVVLLVAVAGARRPVRGEAGAARTRRW